MKAVVLTQPTPADQVTLTSVPTPKVQPGWVLIKVKAFGLNHSEKILRLSEIEADYIQNPLFLVLNAWAKLPIRLTASGLAASV